MKLMGITKTRMAAKRLCDRGRVLLVGKSLKPSHELEGGETLEVLLPQKEIRFKVLEIPATHSVSKSDRAKFFSVDLVKEL